MSVSLAAKSLCKSLGALHWERDCNRCEKLDTYLDLLNTHLPSELAEERAAHAATRAKLERLREAVSVGVGEADSISRMVDVKHDQSVDLFVPYEVDVDGRVDAHGVQYWGKATRQPDGTYRALANVGGYLCVVEARITLGPLP